MDPERGDDTTFPVIKRMAPHQPGAVKLARRYGDALVCVRYRQDPDGQHRRNAAARLWRAPLAAVKALGLAARVMEK